MPGASASVAIWAICPMPAFGDYHAAHRNMPSIWGAYSAQSAQGGINFYPPSLVAIFPQCRNLGQEVEDGVNGKTFFLDFKMTAVPNATPAQIYIDFSWLISQNDGDKHN